MKKLIFAAALLLALPAHAITVEQVVDKANHMAYYQGEDGRAKVNMTITDNQGRERTRNFVILRKDTGEGDTEQKFYVYFKRPADVSGTSFLVWKHIGQDDDRWLYLPALDLVKRIAASDERTSFVGSHFFYEDVSGRGTEEDTHELVESTENYYVVKSVPKDKDTAEFAYYKNYIHQKTFLPVKTEYYDGSDNKYREYVVEKVETVQGNPTIVRSRMKDLRSGGETVLDYSEVKYDAGLPGDIFSERYLRTPPREHLR
jgi:outer membrane lipoprotein-sorting protein